MVLSKKKKKILLNKYKSMDFKIKYKTGFINIKTDSLKYNQRSFYSKDKILRKYFLKTYKI